MFEVALFWAVRIFVIPLGWFIKMLHDTSSIGYFMWIFLIVTVYRLLIVPLIGQEAGSDKAKKKEKED